MSLRWPAVKQLRAQACCLVVALLSLSTARAEDTASERADPVAAEAAAEATDMPRTKGYLGLATAPVFLSRSHLYWGTPVGSPQAREPLVFALEYAFHLPAYNNLRQQALVGKPWAGAVTLSFEGALRMLALPSTPVRMPSYQPSFSGQLFHLWYRPFPILFGLRLALSHHSNGQEDCTFDAALPDETPACAAAIDRVQDPAGELNRRTGNFSINALRTELDLRLHETERGVAIGHLAAGIAFAGYIRTRTLGVSDATQRMYGWGRMDGFVEGQRRFGRSVLRTTARVIHFAGSDSRVPSTAGSVEFVVGPHWLTGFGFFARYYGGRDFYNAFFVDSIHQFSAGLVWEAERPLRFGAPNAQQAL